MIVDAHAINAAAAGLRAGELVIMPTETVYGLAADAASPNAVARIFAAKGRPRFNPLIAHVRDMDEALRHADLNESQRLLAAHFWPGPITFVALRKTASTIAELACAGLPSVAVRAPNHPTAQALIDAFGGPLVAPSANRSGRITATTAQHAMDELGAAARFTLDAGRSALGLESTIIGANARGAPLLLRPGAVPREAIEALIGPLEFPATGALAAPGMLASHYAPQARLRLNASEAGPGEVFLAFGPAAEAPGHFQLSSGGDLIEAAANLYAMLRAADAQSPAAIAVAPIPEMGIGEAINDRLRRAAHRD